MVGDVADHDFDVALIIFPDIQIIIIIAAGLLAVDAFSGNIQACHHWIPARQKMLLHVHGQTQGLAHAVAFFETFGHLIDDITCIADFIIRRDLNFFVKVAVSDVAQALNDLAKGEGQISADQYG